MIRGDYSLQDRVREKQIDECLAYEFLINSQRRQYQECGENLHEPLH